MELGRSAHRLLSVRTRLIAFALLCAVPVLVLTALQLHRDVELVQQQAAGNARLLAERLEMRLGLLLGTAESVAHAAGALDLVANAPGGRGCSAALARALGGAGALALNYSLSSPTGDIWCSARPVAPRANIGERPHFQQAVALKRPVLSGLTMGKVLRQPVVLLAVPVLDARGEVKAVATAALDGPALALGLLDESRVSTTIALLDRDGVLVSRAPPHPEASPGRSFVSSALFRHASSGTGEAAELPGLDGRTRQFVTRPVLYRGEPVLWIAAGVDVEALERLTQAARWRELALVLLVAGAVVLLAVAATRPLVLARVRALTEVAGRVSAGEYGRRVPLRVRDDLTPVEQAFNHMLASVQADRAVLADSESRYRMLFEHSLDGVLQTTPAGAILAANPAACRMLGRSEAELTALTRTDLVDVNDPRLPVLLRQRSETGQARGELAMVRGDGGRLEVAIASSAYRDSQGRERTCIVFHDMTERKAAEQQVLRLNRELEARVAQRTQDLQLANRELEAFSYSVSHDLRAPVAVIRSFSEVLEGNDSVQGDKNRHYLRRIRAAGQQMSDLIDGLLALAHISRTPLEWSAVDVSALAREAVQQLADVHPHPAVEVEVAPGMQACGDARLLGVVLHNLLSNACKFSGRREFPRVSVQVSAGPAGEQVFCVRDNGEGFEPGQAHRLFVAFQRLHAASEFPGLGIGLATVQRIVQRHGGRIWAESAPGGGAAFYFVLGAPEGRRAPSAGSTPAHAVSVAAA